MGQIEVLLSIYSQENSETPIFLSDTSFWIGKKADIEPVLRQMNVPTPGVSNDVETIIETQYKNSDGPIFERQRIENIQPFLGVEIETSINDGSKILQILDEPARKARLKVNDIIVQADQMPIESSADLLNFVRSHEAGDKVRLHFIRNGKQKKTNAVLGGSKVVYYEELVVAPSMDVSVTIRIQSKRHEDVSSPFLSRSSLLSPTWFHVYPNPNQGSFQIELELEDEGQTQIQVFSLSGQLLHEQQLSQSSSSIVESVDLSEKISAGVYVLQLVQGTQATNKRLFVID